MKLSQIREELIAQHAELRRLAANITTEAAHVMQGEGASAEGLRALLARLDTALVAHNVREEALLRDELRTIDAWGPLREALMDDAHEAEHASIVRALRQTAMIDDAKVVAGQALEVVKRVVGHIEAEEREILHPDLLRDDIVSILAASD